VPIPLGFLDGSLGPEDDTAGVEAELAENLEPRTGDTQSQVEAEGVPAKCSRLPTEPAITAAAAGDSDGLRLALREGWPPDKTCSGATALHWAAGSGHRQCCEVLLHEFSASIDYSGRSGRTALHWAARNSQTEICQWLVEQGADPLKVTHDGVNLFHWAVFGRSIDTARWTISTGADPAACNRWGCSAIHWAASTGDTALCLWLEDEVGLDFALCNNQGHDGLMKAAWNGAWELCRHLCTQYPACLSRVDRAGMAPSEMAHVNGHHELAAWLADQEAKELGKNTDSKKAAQAGSKQYLKPSLVDQPALTSADFVVYYRNQGLVPAEQWEALHAALVKPPPVVLRLRGLFGSRLPNLLASEAHGAAEADAALQEEMCFARGSLRAMLVCNTSWKRWPHRRQLFECATRAGLVDAQVDVEDMLSVELLGLEPGHAVLDMCAGSCSRALSCVDAMLHGCNSAAGHVVPAADPAGHQGVPNPTRLTGILIANGENAKYFVEASSFLRRGSLPLVATISNPVRFPCLFSQDGSQELYDRVICTPPSTEDGLIRSKAHMWREWRMSAALPCHTRQVKLLLRGLHLLAPGGRLLFSMRSLNPLEVRMLSLCPPASYSSWTI